MSQQNARVARRRLSLSCPSSHAKDPEAKVFGVVLGSADAPDVAYLREPVPLASALPTNVTDVRPTELYRLVGTCVGVRCGHYVNSRCRLAEHVVATLAVVASSLPLCSIRQHCRWFHEQRAQACFRCPQVVTELVSSTESSPIHCAEETGECP